jgi:hypothetical protein
MHSLSIPHIDTAFSFFLIFFPLILGLLHASFKNGKKTECVLLYYIVIGVGIQGLASGITQTFYSGYVTQYVQWPFSPFILELGLANISYGILGILSPWMSRGWQNATAFGYALFLFFTGMRHTIEIIEKGINAGNSGSFMYVDNILCYIFFALLFLRYREDSLVKPVESYNENEIQ